MAVDEPLHEHPIPELTEAERAIGRHCAELIEDGATLQLGIGAIPNAVLAALGGHQDLRQRARALIGVAHPDHREGLERTARERFGRLD